jgi:archaellum biogenesis ATPase FlaH
MNEILKTALELASRKISVMPVGKDKIPLIKWQVFQKKIASQAEIEDWWKKFPQAQLGIITGELSNMTVVDVEAGGDVSKLPATAIATTGGGGWHYYYRYHQGYKNKARIAPLTDIRGEGGYVMAPPSISDKGPYEWQQRINPTIFPHWLFAADKKTVPVRGGLPEYDGTSSGSRNNDLTSYLGKILNIIHPADWQTLAWAELLKANSRNVPPLPDHEVRNIFNSITNSEKRKPLKSHYKISTPTPDEIDIVPIHEATERNGVMTTPFPIGYPVFDDAIKGGVREGDLIVVTGLSGHGKTTFVQNITVNLAQRALMPLWFSYEVLLDNLYAKFKDIARDELPIYVPKKIVSGNVEWISNKISSAIEKYGVKFVFIDHIDFLHPKQSTGLDQRRIMLKDICQELKSLAIEKKVIIFLIAHTKKVQGREVEMQDVAESSGIYQLADLLMSVNRKTEKINDGNLVVEVMSDVSIAKILKNRITGQCPFFVFKVNNGKIVLDNYYGANRNYQGPVITDWTSK